MFGKKTINMELIVPTSKVTLKTTCIQACGGDIELATKLYDFYVKDLKNLPDFDAVKPTVFQQAKEMIGGTLSWVDNNQDKIMGYYNLFQMIRGGQPIITPSAPIADVPPIPTE